MMSAGRAPVFSEGMPISTGVRDSGAARVSGRAMPSAATTRVSTRPHTVSGGRSSTLRISSCSRLRDSALAPATTGATSASAALTSGSSSG